MKAKNGRALPARVVPVLPALVHPEEETYLSGWLDALRQFQDVHTSTLQGFAALWQTTLQRLAAPGGGWQHWLEFGNDSVRDLVDEIAKHESEWFSTLAQCQMQAMKTLLDLGGAMPGLANALPVASGAVGEPLLGPLAAWTMPWLEHSAARKAAALGTAN